MSNYLPNRKKDKPPMANFLFFTLHSQIFCLNLSLSHGRNDMLYQPINHPPSWAIADRVIDITDAWLEQTDPENERNEVCLAYLHSEKYDDGMRVAGIAIEDNDGTTYRNRDWAVKILGADAIWRVEEWEMEAGQ